ncbi:MAG TPA: histidinol-phosphatase [Mycobacteriales bacterium]|nr:histidinol-phosphatase [Mycobacteriales bacterium]
MTDWTADLELAHALADAADAITMARFAAADLVVETKPDLTPVSDADRAVEDAVRKVLADQRPNDAVLGEERGSSGSGSRRWIVDPIDGTKGYVRGAPSWATLLALEAGDEIVLGVVSAPALSRRWWACRGGGAWARSPSGTKQCQVSRVHSLPHAFLSYSSLTGWEKRGLMTQFVGLTNGVWRTRAYGDFWSHVLVAEGVADISCEPEVSLWDLAALKPIVEEAGGRFTDLGGEARADGGSVVCTNGLLHEQVLAVLSA